MKPAQPAPLADRRSDLALAAEQLRSDCDVGEFGFATTAEVTGAIGALGQERAVEALELGLALRRPRTPGDKA